jgi:hypothetical protein
VSAERNEAGRTPAEERLVGWCYYLRWAIAHYDRSPEVVKMATDSGYKNPANMLRDLETALSQAAVASEHDGSEVILIGPMRDDGAP